MGEIYDQVRQTIASRGVLQSRIAEQAKISNALLSRFVSGERGLSVEALERLLAVLNLEVVLRPRRMGRKGK